MSISLYFVLMLLLLSCIILHFICRPVIRYYIIIKTRSQLKQIDDVKSTELNKKKLSTHYMVVIQFFFCSNPLCLHFMCCGRGFMYFFCRHRHPLLAHTVSVQCVYFFVLFFCVKYLQSWFGCFLPNYFIGIFLNILTL